MNFDATTEPLIESEHSESVDEDFNPKKQTPSALKQQGMNKKSKKTISKRPRKRNRRVKLPVVTEDKQDFTCEKCGEVFFNGWALGGHASRVHPGESEAYRKKIQRRDEREYERNLLRMAKERHIQLFGENTPINRVKMALPMLCG